MRDYSKLLKLAKKNNGIIQTKMAVENNISKQQTSSCSNQDKNEFIN